MERQNSNPSDAVALSDQAQTEFQGEVTNEQAVYGARGSVSRRFNLQTLTPNQVLQLQRTVGNQAVLRLLAKRASSKPAPAVANSIQRVDKVEAPNTLTSLYKRKYKRIGSRSIILTDTDGVPNQPITTRKLVKANRLQMVNPNVVNPANVPAGTYSLVKFMDVDVDQTVQDQINLNWVYGLAEPGHVKALAAYQNISTIPASATNPKQGKILPAHGDPPISQTDVYQSAISDCYLQAAMIAIVNQNPGAITALFTGVTANDVEITFPGYNDHGALNPPQKVTVNKNLFFTPEGEPLYGGKKDSYLWPAFLQKAWAVHKGDYKDLPMGTSFEIMGMITGQAANLTQIRKGDAADEAWEMYRRIVLALNNNRPVIISTKKWTDRKTRTLRSAHNVMPSKADHGGIGIAHSYAVLNINSRTLVRNVATPAAMPAAILTLRDPRTRDGSTITLALEKLLDSRKFAGILIGG